MNDAYRNLSVEDAATEIHRIILEVYKKPHPSKEIVNAILKAKFGIVLHEHGFFFGVQKLKDGSLEVRCTFKAPAPNEKSFLGTWV